MGFLVGPPFATALQAYSNDSARIAIQGVDYPSLTSKGEGSVFGAMLMATLANVTATQCPDTRLVFSGYSQGALVVRRAASSLTATPSTLEKVSSVVLFGDPKNGTAIDGLPRDRVRSICHEGDKICQGGSLVLPQHLNYSSDVPGAAMFVLNAAGVGMASEDAVLQGMESIPGVGDNLF